MSARRGDVLVSQAQRSRMLHSAVSVVSEFGYAQMSVSRVTTRAGVSRRTFYDVFEDREDCFLAAFEDAVERARGLVLEAYGCERGWRQGVRSALAALLQHLDEEPGVRSLLIVDALQGGPKVLERRADLLDELGEALHREGSEARASRGLPTLTGEGVVGAVLGVVHTRLQRRQKGSMLDLLNPLMAMIVLPYLGPAAAQRELGCPTSTPEGPPVDAFTGEKATVGTHDPLAGLPMRVTYRTLRVLSVIGESLGASNREVAARAGISDQGQMSRLLTRLERLGLVQNTGPGQPSGEPNAWRLTAKGQEIHKSIQVPPSAADHQSNVTREPHSDVNHH
jgi:AcrR family transcriptional regulator/DNA-binding MarR family transcriptional regulator